jgi:hypothetical protein
MTADGDSKPACVRLLLPIGLLALLLGALFIPAVQRVGLTALYTIGPTDARLWALKRAKLDHEHRALPLFMNAALDIDPQVRNRAIVFMSRFGEGSEAAIPLLISIIKKDKDYRCRGHAAHALGDLGAGSPEVVNALTIAANDVDLNVVIAAGVANKKLKLKMPLADHNRIAKIILDRVSVHSSGLKRFKVPRAK